MITPVLRHHKTTIVRHIDRMFGLKVIKTEKLDSCTN